MPTAMANASTQNTAACHPERSEGPQPLRLASQSNRLGSAGIRAGSWAFSSTIYDSRTASHELQLTAFVGTAFRGGPPTQFLASQQLRRSEQREDSLFAFTISRPTNHNSRFTNAVNSN